MMRITFLGTGAAGGTPGQGASRRRESSLLLSDRAEVLIDAPRHLDTSLEHPEKLEAMLLTHAHHDAAEGLTALGRRRAHAGSSPLPLYSSPKALEFLGRRGDLNGFRSRPIEPGRSRRLSGGLRIRAVEVPHARQERYRTYAWRVDSGRSAFVYASDVGRLQTDLERLCWGAELLILDGAMWRRSLFSHLRIDRDLPIACNWPVKRILLTQIGRTAPPHQQLEQEVKIICPKATPARDGLQLRLG